MSSPQAIDGSKIVQATAIAQEAAQREKQTALVDDATSKRVAAAESRDGDIDMTDAVAQAGRQLSREVIQARLKKLNPSLRFERTRTDQSKCAIYFGEKFLCGMEWNPSPEFTVKFVGEGAGKAPELLYVVKGWRALLDQLIRAGAIESGRTKELFQIAKGRESANWNALHNA